MRLSVRANILSNRNKKAMTILIGFLLIVSGIFVSTLAVGADRHSGARGSRAVDADFENNTFAPTLEDNTTLAASYLNNGTTWVFFNATAYDDDDSNDTILPQWNGTDIASVKINLTGFALGILDMNYDGNWSDPAYNASRNEGFYTHNMTIPWNQAPGDYNVTINATDNGLFGYALNATGILLVVTVDQHNRNITKNASAPTQIVLMEDGPDKYVELDENVFIDPDIIDPNIVDSLSFQVWDGDSWETNYNKENFTVTVVPATGNVTFDPLPNKVTAAAGEDIMFRGMDTAAHWKPHTITVKITEANDPPSWLNAPTIPVDVTEGTAMNISVDAEDMDTTSLMYTAYMFIGDDDTNTSWELTVDEPLPKTANISLLVDDKEVYLDKTGLSINLTVDDSQLIDYAIIELNIKPVNDDPMLEYGVPIATLDTDVNEDETGYNITFKATDYDTGEDLSFNFDVDKYTGHDSTPEDKIDITKYNPTDAKYDYDTETYTPGVAEAKLNFTPDNDDVGYIHINVSVTDGDVEVWLVTNITIANTNDAPFFTKAAGAPVTTGDTLDYTGTNNVTVGEYLNITIEADDDDLIHGGETLTFSANVVLITDGVLSIDKVTDTSADFSFIFPEAYEGTDTYNITVTDGDETDWFLIDIEVWKESDVVEPVNNKPTITITTQSGKKFQLGESIVIEGTWSDPDLDDIEVEVDITFPDGTEETGYGVVINSNGTWKYSYDTSVLKATIDFGIAAIEAGQKAGLSGSQLQALEDALNDMKDQYIGIYTFTFKAIDIKSTGTPKESDPASVTAELEGDIVIPSVDDDDDDGLLGMGKVGGIDTFLLLLIIIIVVIIIVVAVIAKKKKAKAAAAEEEAGLAPPPTEMACTACGATIPAGEAVCPACGAPAPPPPEVPPPTEMACTACGVMIPAGEAICPACGAQAPPPPEAAPPMEMNCTACGAIIPAGSPTCPTCGAAAPLPAEAPPEVMTCVTCGQVIPPGSPTCPACGAPAPPTGPPAEAPPPPMEEAYAPPPEGMPPAAPPPEGAPPPMEEAYAPPPPEGVPPVPEAGAPPEAPPPEGMPPAAPPPEGAPPPAEAPPQMIPCPQCGGQLGVGVTPCPNCGAQLNWG